MICDFFKIDSRRDLLLVLDLLDAYSRKFFSQYSFFSFIIRFINALIDFAVILWAIAFFILGTGLDDLL